MIKNLPTMQETWVQSLGGEDPLEKEMATHFSILAWRIPRTEEPGGLQSMGSQRVGHTEPYTEWATCYSATKSTSAETLWIDIWGYYLLFPWDSARRRFFNNKIMTYLKRHAKSACYPWCVYHTSTSCVHPWPAPTRPPTPLGQTASALMGRLDCLNEAQVLEAL